MSEALVTVDDFSTYLGATGLDEDRVQMILGLAQALCEGFIGTLPAGAEAVIMDVATRAYSNPANAVSETTGPYSASFGAVSGGLWLTRQNKATLRSLSGRGGVFSVDVLPATAGQNLPRWDSGFGYGPDNI